MKGYKWLVLSLVIFFSGIALIPVIAFPWTENIDWQGFASDYIWEGPFHPVFLPIIVR